MAASQVVAAPLWSRPRRLRMFASAPDAERDRRPTDVLVLLGSLLAVVVVVAWSNEPSGVDEALGALARSLPDVLRLLWLVLAGATTVWVLVLLVASLVSRRVDLLRDAVLATLLTSVLVAVVDLLRGDRSESVSWRALLVTGPPETAVSLRLAVLTAVVVVVSPHLTRPFRRTSAAVLLSGALALVVLGTTAPSGAVLGLLCGAIGASAVHLALGTGAGQPSLAAVADVLAELGVDATGLRVARRQRAGASQVEAHDAAGRRLVVTVVGRDAWDAQLLSRSWRMLWYRGGSGLALTGLQQVEREAFLLLLAQRHGVVVDEVVTAGRGSGSTAVLVVAVDGTSVSEVAQGERARVVAGMWDAVLLLEGARISHGDLGLGTFRVRGRDVVLTGLASASVSVSGDLRRVDVAQLLVTTALLVGVEDAVATAREHIGVDGLAAVAPYLQVAALGRSLRADVRAADLDLDALRSATAAAAGTPEVTIARLRRVSPSGLIRVALLSLAAYTIISLLTGIDYAQVVDSLSGAHWGLVALALVVGQLPRLAQAESTRGACPRPLPFGPVALLQMAIAFVSLVLPGSAARVGINIRFFQKQGVPPASALSIGLIDSLAGFAVEAAILVTVLVLGFGDVQFDLERRGADGPLMVVLLALAGAVLLAVLAVALVPRLRHRVVERVTPWLHEALETVRGLRSLTKVAQLVGGNVAAEIFFALTLALALAAFDASLSFGTLLVIIVGVALFSGLMPVPGSIGVAEGALVFGMTAAGIDQATAFAAAITYRAITFYLPPLWGGVAFRRLERDGLL